MFVNSSPIPEFLKNLSLFNSLDEFQIGQIAQLFVVISRNTDDVILTQGDRADGFYILMDGQVAVEHQIDRSTSQADVYVIGDFFGEDSLLADRPEPATVTALTPVTLLALDKDTFNQLIKDYPEVENRLNRFVKSHQYLKTLRLDWLNEDEVVYQIRRRHVAYLIVLLWLPVVILTFGFALIGASILLWGSGWPGIALLIFAAVVLGLGLALAIWGLLDWGNDYYVITNQRVVWVEKVIWLYDSRIEAPLNTILSVNIKTVFLGRLLGYGDVIVTTYTGKVVFETVGNPYQLSSLISEYLQRYRQEGQQADLKEIRRSVKRILGEAEEKPPATTSANLPSQTDQKKPDQRKPDEPREHSFWAKYFGNVFKTRVEEGKIITYRKHWLMLFRKTWLPLLLGFVLLFVVAYFDIMYLIGRSGFSSPIGLTIAGFSIGLLILFPWWLYNYVDWRNDIYQVTDRSIFDIERRPFGTESRKTASLENILSLEHKRPGFIGYILNVGFVVVNVGETKFTFDFVYEPARVQQDIFNRMHALRIQKQKEETGRERERMLKLIEIYHDEVNK